MQIEASSNPVGGGDEGVASEGGVGSGDANVNPSPTPLESTTQQSSSNESAPPQGQSGDVNATTEVGTTPVTETSSDPGTGPRTSATSLSSNTGVVGGAFMNLVYGGPNGSAPATAPTTSGSTVGYLGGNGSGNTTTGSFVSMGGSGSSSGSGSGYAPPGTVPAFGQIHGGENVTGGITHVHLGHAQHGNALAHGIQGLPDHHSHNHPHTHSHSLSHQDAHHSAHHSQGDHHHTLAQHSLQQGPGASNQGQTQMTMHHHSGMDELGGSGYGDSSHMLTATHYAQPSGTAAGSIYGEAYGDVKHHFVDPKVFSFLFF